MKKVSRYIGKVLSLLALLSLSGLAIYWINHYAFLYVGFVWLVIISVFVKFAKTDRKRLLWIYTGSIILTLFIAELYFSGLLRVRYLETTFEQHVIVGGHNKSHDILGLAPIPNSKWSRKFTFGDSVVFDVIQTIDSNGLRYTSGKLIDNAEVVLFLGGSFTFGTGLNDNETLPYYLQAESLGQLKSINLGYSSYGAHQMLALLEEGLEQKVLMPQIPKTAIYSAIPDHTFRGTTWREESFGTRYVLGKQAELIKKRVFLYNPSLGSKLLGKSHLVRRFLFRRGHSKAGERDLLIAMIEKSSRMFTERYSAPFYCLLWDELAPEPGLYDAILSQLKVRNINIIEVRDVLPGYKENPKKYLLYGDNHPNALANRLIGEYLYKLIGE